MQVMGHVRATYAREMLPSVHLATRYEVNLNDLHCRTAGGIELRPTHSLPYIIKAKYDTEVHLILLIGRSNHSVRPTTMRAFCFAGRAGPGDWPQDGE